MLLPKRVKYRRVQRGRMTGKAMRGNKVNQGDYGLVALEPAWITSNQIEAARVAMTRYILTSSFSFPYLSPILFNIFKNIFYYNIFLLCPHIRYSKIFILYFDNSYKKNGTRQAVDKKRESLSTFSSYK